MTFKMLIYAEIRESGQLVSKRLLIGAFQLDQGERSS